MDKRITQSDKEIYVFDNYNKLSEYAVALWRQFSQNAIADHDYFAVALSGGKTPKEFYQVLARHDDLPWNRTHIFQVDERFVKRDHPDSNYKLINDNLLIPLNLPEKNIHSIKTDVPIDKSIVLYRNAINNFFHIADSTERFTETAPPQFDLVMLGIGEDGHTASLFPFQLDTFETPKNVVATSGSHVMHERVTLTLPAIKQSKNIIFLVTGENKAEIVKRVIDNDPELPASFVKPVAGKLFFLLDRGAAGKL
ncbi:MAG: 6-phosphogluconolactonase [Gammaproteobacteria bacterium]|jgi:6-phosphogluconolactonase